MKKTGFILLFFLFAFGLKAQEAEWSNTEKFRTRTAYNRILGENETGIYVLRGKNRYFTKKVFIQLYENSMGLKMNKLLPGMKRATFENALVYEKYLRIFKSRFNNETKRIELFHQVYTTGAEPQGEEIKISESPQKDYSDLGDYYVRESQDKSKVLCFHTEIAPDKNVIIHIQVFDAETMVPLGDKKVELPYMYGNFEAQDLTVQNNGNAYFIFRVEDVNLKKDAYEHSGYYLYAFKADENRLSDFYLNNDDTYLNRLLLTIDYLNQRLIVNGLYSLEGLGSSKGILDFTLNTADFTVAHHNFIAYPYPFVVSAIGQEMAENEAELHDYFIKKIIPRSDGGYMIVAEEFFTTTQTYTFFVNGLAQVSTREIFNYGKVAILSVAADSEIEWGKVINKAQTSMLDGGYYSSIYVMNLKNKIHIFYNDENRGSSEVTLYTLNNKGVLDSKLLFKSQNSNIAIVPKEAKQLDEETILFPTAKDRKFAFLKLVID